MFVRRFVYSRYSGVWNREKGINPHFANFTNKWWVWNKRGRMGVCTFFFHPGQTEVGNKRGGGAQLFTIQQDKYDT